MKAPEKAYVQNVKGFCNEDLRTIQIYFFIADMKFFIYAHLWVTVYLF